MTRVFLSTRMSGRRRDTWATCAVPTYKVCRRGVALRPPNSHGSQPFPTPPPTHPRTLTSQEATPAGDTTVLRAKQDSSRVKGHEADTLTRTHAHTHASRGRIQHHQPVYETRVIRQPKGQRSDSVGGRRGHQQQQQQQHQQRHGPRRPLHVPRSPSPCHE